MTREEKRILDELGIAVGELEPKKMFLLLMRRLSLIDKGTKDVLSFKEACAYMDCSATHLRELCRSQKVARCKPECGGKSEKSKGGRIYFLRADLDAYMQQNRIPSIHEIDQMAADYMLARK